MKSKLRDSVIEFSPSNEVRKNVEEALNRGLDPHDVVNALSNGLHVIGERYEKGEAFLGEMIAAGEVMREAMEVLRPHFKGDFEESLGVVSIGTVSGDLHDIGKNIVKAFLISNGFKVQDLGVDVATEKFTQSVKVGSADIVALSALLTNALPEIRKVIRSLEEAGLRSKVKVIVGGAALDERVARDVLADAYGTDAVSGAATCVNWRRDV